MFSLLKKDKKEENKESEECDSWMFELIVQYLSSPLWDTPISDFLDSHCHLFLEDESNYFNYT